MTDANWTALSIDRVDPPTVADERTSLDAWLDYHRVTLLQKCAGLSADQLKLRSAPPSTLSLLGLVRHMAEVERSWFQRRVAGRDVPFIHCARHNGHADLLRERIDGATGM